MNTHLVCPARLEPAFNQGKFTQVLDNAEVGDRPLAGAGLSRTAAPPIASVTNQPRVDFSGPGPTADHRQIAALDRVGTELAAKFSLCFRSARKNHQAARVFVKAVNGPEEVARGRGGEGARGRRRFELSPLGSVAFSAFGRFMGCQEEG
jgi:hypothetical protein